MEPRWERLFFRNSPVPFGCLRFLPDATGHSTDFEFIEVNPAFLKAVSRPKDAVIGKRFFEFFSEETEKNPDWVRLLTQTIKHPVLLDHVFDHLLPGKSVRLRIFPLDSEFLGLILRDTTQETLFRNEIEGFLDISVDMVCIADPAGRFIRVNNRFEEVLGYPVESLNGREFLSLIHEDDLEATRAAMQDLDQDKADTRRIVNRFRCLDGSYKSLEWQAFRREGLVFASARDVTESVKREEVLKTAAIIDPLTGLYNRNFFFGRIYEEILRSETELSPLSMIAIDIDHFKYVNDIWGHPVGDEILERTGRLLKGVLRTSDVLCRIGGEEFVVLLKNTQLEGAMVVARKMHAALNENPHPRVGKVTASFGIAERTPGEDFTLWYKRADDAVYAAKESGRNTISVAGHQELPAVTSLYLSWKETWNSGNHVIDGQHRELVEMGNHLTFLTVSAASPVQIASQIEKLLEHVARHFSDEETILEESQWQGVEEHRKIHGNLLRAAERVVDDFQKKKTQTPIALSFLITDLILGHMVTEDCKFFPFVKPV
jgi:diguanylate cyclase (GGDEF)-like protein/hemerythrin-like metal-binding protein/PAS domain S-box-containing protein